MSQLKGSTNCNGRVFVSKLLKLVFQSLKFYRPAVVERSLGGFGGPCRPALIKIETNLYPSVYFCWEKVEF